MKSVALSTRSTLDARRSSYIGVVGFAAALALSAQIALRCAFPPLAVGQVLNASLAPGDCAIHGSWFNDYAVTTSQPVTAVRFTLGPHALQHPFLGVRDPSDANTSWGWSASAPVSLSFKALMPAGQNGAEVTTTQAHEAGNFSLAALAAPEDLTCESPEPWIIGSLTTAQQLGANDCTDGSYLGDFALVGLDPAERLTVSVSSDWFRPSIALIDPYSGEVVVQAQGERAATLTFTAGAANTLFYLAVTSQDAGGSGPYSLSVGVAPAQLGAAAPTAPASRAERIAWPHRLVSPAPRGMVPVWSSRSPR